MNYDVIIVGGGAAGLMCAIEAGKRGRRVVVLEHAERLGKKILISGGGRCNFTNTRASAANFVTSGSPHFCKSMSNSGLVPDATGRIDGKLVRQGNANNQKFDIDLKHLAANTTYHLSALIGDDTNLTSVAEFDTDDAGSAKLHYRRMGKDGNHGLGRGKSAMPGALNPISNLRELAVVDTNAQTVLSADLTAPDKLQYLVKRTLTNDGAEPDAAATLRIKGTTASTQFRLLASGLQTNASYSLVINGNVDETKTADAKGKLSFTTLLVNPLDILDVRTLSIWNSTSNSVLSTQLP